MSEVFYYLSEVFFYLSEVFYYLPEVFFYLPEAFYYLPEVIFYLPEVFYYLLEVIFYLPEVLNEGFRCFISYFRHIFKRLTYTLSPTCKPDEGFWVKHAISDRKFGGLDFFGRRLRGMQRVLNIVFLNVKLGLAIFFTCPLSPQNATNYLLNNNFCRGIFGKGGE